MLSIFKHLLIRSRAFNLTWQSTLRKFFEGLATPVIDDTREFLNAVWLDMFPATTREIRAWEGQFGLTNGEVLTENERRERLAGIWAATGGQSPRYIQDTLQAAGFNVYVHEWWDLPATSPPTVRDPFDVMGSATYGAGDPQMEAGEVIAQAGNYLPIPGNVYMLVNKIYTADMHYTCCAGDTVMEAGEAGAQAGDYSTVDFIRKQYPIPNNPTDWRYILYIGGETFGDLATINEDRQGELEDLLLKICPSHIWISMLIDLASPLIDDETGYYLIDDETGYTLLDG